MGRIVSNETRKKLREANTGHIVSTETREKIRKANKGRVRSDKTKDKLRGRKLSIEIRQKISASQIKVALCLPKLVQKLVHLLELVPRYIDNAGAILLSHTPILSSSSSHSV